MLPLGTPVLVAWPGFPTLRGEVTSGALDGSAYHVVGTGADAVAADCAVFDLRTLSGVPASAFSDVPGCA